MDDEQLTQNGSFAIIVIQTGSQTSIDQGAKMHHLNFLESACPSINVVDVPEFTEFPIVLDSGAADHVVDSADTPGYALQESWGSKAGACFVAANGERILNKGEVCLNIRAGTVPIQSTFQVSKISRPLWSVGKPCDAGYTVQFHKDHAEIRQVATGKVVGTCERKQGLYIGALQLRNPACTTATAVKQPDASSTFQRRTR